MASLALGVKFNPTLGGTTDWVYSSAVTGYVGPAASNPAMVNGRIYRYRAENASLSEWEWGFGAYTSASQTIARTTITLSSTGSKVSFSAPPVVGVIPFPADILQFDDAMSLTAAQQGQGLANLNAKFGQCILIKSGSNIVLTPNGGGNLLTINGQACAVPAAGISLAPTGLTVGTTYNIYATASAGAVNALEASTTAHLTSSTAGNVGVEIKTGDDTRSLVGQVRPIAGPAFADTATQRFVLSWFNRPRRKVRNITTAIKSATTSWVELDSTLLRCEFLIWSDELVQATVLAHAIGTNTPLYWGLSVGFDSVTPEDPVYGWTGSAQSQPADTYTGVKDGLTEGYHYVTALGKTNTGTATYGDPAVGFPSINAAIG